MTTKELAAKAHEATFKIKEVIQKYTPDGQEMYVIECYPRYGSHWSKYPVSMFIQGKEAVSIYNTLSAYPEGALVILYVSPGKLKQDKEGNLKPDDGKFENYFWNVAGLAQASETTTSAVTTSPTIEHPVPRIFEERDVSIQRQVALKAATELAIAHIGKGTPIRIENILETATAFARWLQRLPYLTKAGLQDAPSEGTEPAPVSQVSEAPDVGSGWQPDTQGQQAFIKDWLERKRWRGNEPECLSWFAANVPGLALEGMDRGKVVKRLLPMNAWTAEQVSAVHEAIRDQEAE